MLFGKIFILSVSQCAKKYLLLGNLDFINEQNIQLIFKLNFQYECKLRSDFNWQRYPAGSLPTQSSEDSGKISDNIFNLEWATGSFQKFFFSHPHPHPCKWKPGVIAGKTLRRVLSYLVYDSGIIILCAYVRSSKVADVTN